MVRLHDEVSVRGLSHPPPDHNIPPKVGVGPIRVGPFCLPTEGAQMNKARRKRIQGEVIAKLDEAYEALYQIMEEESEYLDSIPENMEEKRSLVEDTLFAMEEQRDAIEEAKNEIAEMIGNDG
jgi:acyl-[acyl carrier protein]--UDP-N-acetylglucosamine O-acyltransferase